MMEAGLENNSTVFLFSDTQVRTMESVNGREDLRKVMIEAGPENNPTVFLFSDTQVTTSC